MLRKINLHGELAETYGSSFELSVDTPREAVRALCAQLRGFERTIREGRWVAIRGDYDDGVVCEELHLTLSFGNVDEFHIVPAAMGAGRGAGKILLGLVLIAGSIATAGIGTAVAFGATALFDVSFSTLGLFALGAGGLLVLSGVSQSIAPTPTTQSATGVDQKQGFIFNGAVNTNQQGGAVPLVFGRVRAGSVIVSAGIDSERIGTGTYNSVPATSGDVVLATGVYS